MKDETKDREPETEAQPRARATHIGVLASVSGAWQLSLQTQEASPDGRFQIVEHYIVDVEHGSRTEAVLAEFIRKHGVDFTDAAQTTGRSAEHYKGRLVAAKLKTGDRVPCEYCGAPAAPREPSPWLKEMPWLLEKLTQPDEAGRYFLQEGRLHVCDEHVDDLMRLIERYETERRSR